MEYQQIANLLDNTSNQPSKFRTKNCFEINDESRRTCVNRQNDFEISMLRSGLCNYSDAYILVNPIQDGGKKPPPLLQTQGISPQNFLTFSFNSFSTLV